MKRTILITGSNSGFGFELATQLASKGHFVIATMRDLNQKTSIEKKLKEDGIDARQVLFAELDVTKEDSISKLIQMLKEKKVKVTVLINNAGYCQGGFLEDLVLADYEKQFQTNYFGMVAMTKAFIPMLKEHSPSRIINVSSVSGIVGLPGMTAYASSKFAVEGFSESLRLELLPEHISVSLIQPGSYKTKIWDKGLENIREDQSSIFKQNLYAEAKKSANKGADPREIVKVVEKIMQVKQPAMRYPLGKSAYGYAALKKILPWSWIEQGVKWSLGKRR